MAEENEYVPPRQPKTKKGRKILENRKPKLDENPRNTLFIRGPKSSDNARLFMKEIYQLKKDFSVLFNRKHDLRPFEESSLLEKYCNQTQCTQFCYLSHSKKRPNNIIIGRLFDEKILDMFELGIKTFESSENFQPQSVVPLHSRPAIIFQGEVFGYNGRFQKFQNLMTDFFFENVKKDWSQSPNQVNLIILVSATEEEVKLQVFSRSFVTKDGETKELVEEIGPRCEFEVRREKLPEEDTFKRACRQPKPKKKKHDKNVKYNAMGDKKGRIFVQQQDLTTLNVKRRKKITKTNQKIQKSAQNQQQEE